jgi:hypothetical protein
MERFYWIFIERTKKQVTLTETQSQEMMKGHLGNFGRLFDLGKLRVAGPMRDPQQTRRGIVLLTVKAPDEIDESFKPDPFFQQGIFSAYSVPMRLDFGDILKVTDENRNSIEENRLVVLERNPEAKGARWEDRDAIRDGAAAGLAFHAKATSNNSVREIAIFRGTNDRAIEAWLAGDPLVRSRALKATIYPQFLGKGVLPENPRPFGRLDLPNGWD